MRTLTRLFLIVAITAAWQRDVSALTAEEVGCIALTLLDGNDPTTCIAIGKYSGGGAGGPSGDSGSGSSGDGGGGAGTANCTAPGWFPRGVQTVGLDVRMLGDSELSPDSKSRFRNSAELNVSDHGHVHVYRYYWDSAWPLSDPAYGGMQNWTAEAPDADGKNVQVSSSLCQTN